MYSSIKISEFLHRKKEIVNIDPDAEYALVTVKLHHKGVVLREKKKGSLLGSSMYKISKGQFILSGIDARNGAFGIVPDELDGAIITNDFWCFDVDEKKVKRDFFYWLSNTPLFLDACVKSSKGETQRIRLQKDLFFNFEFHFPPINMQEDFLQSIQKFDFGLSVLESEQTYQSSHLTRLRQTILQEGIKGKLTAKWREQNPALISGNNHASKLLEKIKAEKERLIKEGNTSTKLSARIKKDKPLAPITDDEKQFDLPEGWVWCRLGELLRISSGDGLTSKEMAKGGDFPVYGGNGINGYHDKANVLKKTIVIGRVGAQCGSVHVTPEKAWVTDNAFITYYHEHYLSENWLEKLLVALNLRDRARETAQPVISGKRVYPIVTALPSFAEQQAIVKRISDLMAMIGELEKQVSERKEQSEMLMQSVLREAFAQG